VHEPDIGQGLLKELSCLASSFKTTLIVCASDRFFSHLRIIFIILIQLQPSDKTFSGEIFG